MFQYQKVILIEGVYSSEGALHCNVTKLCRNTFLLDAVQDFLHKLYMKPHRYASSRKKIFTKYISSHGQNVRLGDKFKYIIAFIYRGSPIYGVFKQQIPLLLGIFALVGDPLHSH